MAQVLVSKYADHLPLYRQAQIYTRQGITLDRSTLADLVGRAAFMLRPVHERLLMTLKSSTKLFADETTAPVLDPGRGRTKTGQLWAYARDDRPWGGAEPRITSRRANRFKSDGRPAFFAHATANLTIVAMATETFLEKRVGASKKFLANELAVSYIPLSLRLRRAFIM